MFRVITIADNKFSRYARRLAVSLKKTNNCHITIFCEDKAHYEGVCSVGLCEAVELPEIKEYGAKRAKFAAYKIASEQGSFLYLDSDIIVLDSLEGLMSEESLVSCYDDLSECAVPDPQFPWPGDPNLRAEVYFNVGVVYFPQACSEFIDRLYQVARDDRIWSNYIFEGVLYCNHFLCAFANIWKEPLVYADEFQYNWQGFVRGNRLQVKRDRNRLINIETGKPLHLAHFAGIKNMDKFLKEMNPDVSSLLMKTCLDESNQLDEDPLLRLIARLGENTLLHCPGPFSAEIVSSQLRDARVKITDGNVPVKQEEFVSANDRETEAPSLPESEVRWNDLRCGGASIEAVEFDFLRNEIIEKEITTVLEIGVGENSILFKRLGLKSCSIGSTEDIFSGRAASAGCAINRIPIDHATGLFNRSMIEDTLKEFGNHVDLVFVNSCAGIVNRSHCAYQILSLADVSYLVFTDVARDAANLTDYQQALKLTLLSYLSSSRGMALFGTSSFVGVPEPNRDQVTTVVSSIDYTLQVDVTSTMKANGSHRAIAHIRNYHEIALSSEYQFPVYLSYHWLDGQGDVISWDNPRSSLPSPVRRGDLVSFPIEVYAPADPGEYFLDFDLIQESISWFGNIYSEGVKRYSIRVVNS